MLNSMLEAVAKAVGVITKTNPLMSILSNYATASLVKATCTIPVGLLQAGRYPGALVAKKSRRPAPWLRSILTGPRPIIRGS